MMVAARANSSRRTSVSRDRTSGVSSAGLRISPSSPPVQHTNTVWTPSWWYRATVPAPLDASSSGWAWTASRQSGSDTVITLPDGEHLSSPDEERGRIDHHECHEAPVWNCAGKDEQAARQGRGSEGIPRPDRKSTRLNSSHANI